MKHDVQLLIQGSSSLIQPSIEDGITWETERTGSPGKLSFTVIKDKGIEFEEGVPVSLIVDGSPLFYGFIFTRQRDKKHHIKVTCYDQIRYLKNKDTYVYEDKTAADLITMIAGDFNLQTGTLQDTGYRIGNRIEDNQSLYDIIQNAMDLTLINTGRLYVFYDDFGKLCLQDIESLKTDVLIDEETGENFDYSSSIDNMSYNKIKLIYENEETGTREIYIAQSGENMNRWGILQFFDKITEKTSGQNKADSLLSYYNKVQRSLKLSGCVGSPKVKAGVSVVVQLDLGDVKLQNYMVVESAKHVFSTNRWTMDLTMRGSDFHSE